MKKYTKQEIQTVIRIAKGNNQTVTTIGGGRINAARAKFQYVKTPQGGWTAIARRK